MASSEESLKFAIVMLLSAIALAIFILRRYGPVWRGIRTRMGPRWPRFIAGASIATLALWVAFWTLIGPEQRADLKRVFQESSPWRAIEPVH